MGGHRRVKVKVSPTETLEISTITCENQAVKAEVERTDGSRYRHIRFLNVELTGHPPSGTHETQLILTTNIKGIERLTIPVRIEVPGSAG